MHCQYTHPPTLGPTEIGRSYAPTQLDDRVPKLLVMDKCAVLVYLQEPCQRVTKTNKRHPVTLSPFFSNWRIWETDSDLRRAVLYNTHIINIIVTQS